uniref:SCP domain-containing protein n=1 Tax=Mesocestoides corti TaxID=53468 RepID=A0A5K3F3X1_MESCO
MRLMRYSTYLETLAQQWTANSSKQPPNSSLLPNHADIALTWVTDLSSEWVSYSSIISIFTYGSAYYIYGNNSCTGHCRLYLQFVWADATEVGCAMSPWGNTSDRKDQKRFLVACAYKPVGNIPGRRPYTNGTSCSACPDGFFCHRNQCTNDTSLLPTTTTTSSTATTFTTSTTNNTTNSTTWLQIQHRSPLKHPRGESWFSQCSFHSFRRNSFQSLSFSFSQCNICFNFLMRYYGIKTYCDKIPYR